MAQSSRPTPHRRPDVLILVRVERLELPRLAAPEPKSGVSTNSTTPARVPKTDRILFSRHPRARVSISPDFRGSKEKSGGQPGFLPAFATDSARRHHRLHVRTSQGEKFLRRPLLHFSSLTYLRSCRRHRRAGPDNPTARPYYRGSASIADRAWLPCSYCTAQIRKSLLYTAYRMTLRRCSIDARP